MFNTCWQCGAYHAAKEIKLPGPYAICPDCGYAHPFRRLPLLMLSGASGTGKSTVCQTLLGQSNDVLLLDSDILWRPEYDVPGMDYHDFFEVWLRMCKNIGQSGRPVVLFGTGTGVPENIEACVERRYFSRVHYLALTCDDDVLVDRLRARPAWRESAETEYLEEQLKFNHWFKSQGPRINPPVRLLDTTGVPVERTAAQVAEWIAHILTAM